MGITAKEDLQTLEFRILPPPRYGHADGRCAGKKSLLFERAIWDRVG